MLFSEILHTNDGLSIQPHVNAIGGLFKGSDTLHGWALVLTLAHHGAWAEETDMDGNSAVYISDEGIYQALWQTTLIGALLMTLIIRGFCQVYRAENGTLWFIFWIWKT